MFVINAGSKKDNLMLFHNTRNRVDNHLNGTKILGSPPSCLECGAALVGFANCQDDFHEMLFWENEHPGYGSVHHLLVLCYHLQHPGLYSPDGLAYGLQLLVDFLENDLTPEEARQRGQEQANSNKRSWKVTARAGWHGSYRYPVSWSIRAGDLTRAGPQDYLYNIQSWAESILADLRASGNLPSSSAPGTGE